VIRFNEKNKKGFGSSEWGTFGRPFRENPFILISMCEKPVSRKRLEKPSLELKSQ